MSRINIVLLQGVCLFVFPYIIRKGNSNVSKLFFSSNRLLFLNNANNNENNTKLSSLFRGLSEILK